MERWVRFLTKIYITQEQFNHKEEFILFENEQKVSKLYIGPSNYDDYDNETKQFLYNFIYTQALFPIFLTFEPYDDLLEYTFRKESIPHSLRWKSSVNKW
jgi:hypothetical protein